MSDDHAMSAMFRPLERIAWFMKIEMVLIKFGNDT